MFENMQALIAPGSKGWRDDSKGGGDSFQKSLDKYNKIDYFCKVNSSGGYNDVSKLNWKWNMKHKYTLGFISDKDIYEHVKKSVCQR